MKASWTVTDAKGHCSVSGGSVYFAGSSDPPPTMNVAFTNNLFLRAYLSFSQDTGSSSPQVTVQAWNNLFYGGTLSVNNNAGPDTLKATSWLGNYYYPTNDGLLSLMIDAVSGYTTNSALYDFTVTTNQVKDSGKVDTISWRRTHSEARLIAIPTGFQTVSKTGCKPESGFELTGCDRNSFET